MDNYTGMPGDERRTKALEIAVSILGPLKKDQIEEADKKGTEIIKHYFWLVKDIDRFIFDRDTFDNLDKQA